MATRSRIGYFNGYRITSIYCHWDGYPQGNGKILLESYRDETKVKNLVALGDISALYDTVDETAPKSYTHQESEVYPATFFFKKDKTPKKYEGIVTKKNFYKKDYDSLFKHWEEFVYIYNVLNGKWYFASMGDEDFKEMTAEDVK